MDASVDTRSSASSNTRRQRSALRYLIRQLGNKITPSVQKLMRAENRLFP